MHIERLDPLDAATVTEWLDMLRAAQDVDVPDFPPPTRQEYLTEVTDPWPGYTVEGWIARADDRVAGWLQLKFPQLDNLDNLELELVVHPGYRRRGIGRALYDRALDSARGEGRRRLFAMTPRPVAAAPASGPGGSFATAVGGSVTLPEVRSRLDVTALEPSVVEQYRTGALGRASGYRVIGWSEAVPEEYLADFAALDSMALAEMPMGDLEWESENIDGGRVRAIEKANLARGRRMYNAGAVHEASGRMVAWTTISVQEGTPDHGWQWVTLVHPGHRGHRLGMAIKADNLLAVLGSEPELRALDTWNAEENSHMIAINRQLGFRPVDTWDNWQHTI